MSLPTPKSVSSIMGITGMSKESAGELPSRLRLRFFPFCVYISKAIAEATKTPMPSRRATKAMYNQEGSEAERSSLVSKILNRNTLDMEKDKRTNMVKRMYKRILGYIAIEPMYKKKGRSVSRVLFYPVIYLASESLPESINLPIVRRNFEKFRNDVPSYNRQPIWSFSPQGLPKRMLPYAA